ASGGWFGRGLVRLIIFLFVFFGVGGGWLLRLRHLLRGPQPRPTQTQLAPLANRTHPALPCHGVAAVGPVVQAAVPRHSVRAAIEPSAALAAGKSLLFPHGGGSPAPTAAGPRDPRSHGSP